MQNEYEEPMKKLIKTVIRTFYEPCHVVITDILLENILLSDTEFCHRMKMLNREFNKLMIRLKDDRLIKSDIKVEVKENNKQILKTIYFFNYAEVRDILKYKIFKMTKALEIKKTELDDSFYCSSCEKCFSALDAQASMDNFVFKCIFCGTELEENISKKGSGGIELKELLDSLDAIIKMLKDTEKFKIPTMDYFQILELKKEKEKAKSSLQPTSAEDGKLAETKIQHDAEQDDYSSDSVKDVPYQIVESKTPSSEDYVTVNGVKRLYSSITEDDKEMMDEDEYTKYFEIYSKYNQ